MPEKPFGARVASIFLTLVLVSLLAACGGGVSVKLYGSPSGVKIGGLLASYLGKHGHTDIKSVGCQKGLLGYRCQVIAGSPALVCDAFGSGFSELGTSKLTDSSCDTRSHYRRVLAQSDQLAHQALYVLNQDTQLVDVMAAYKSEGANIACVVGRQQAGRGLSTNIGFYLVVATTSLPLPPPADVIVTPQGVVTVEHPKANRSDAGIAGCSFNGTGFSISPTHQPNMLVSDTIHARVIPASEISAESAPPATSRSAQTSTPSSNALPKLVNAGSSSPVRPSTFHYSGDASEMLGGLDGGYRNGSIDFGHLKWSKWTATEADATGADWADSCNPNCAAGKFSPSPATVRLFDPVNGYFTRLTVRETYSGKPQTRQFYASVPSTGAIPSYIPWNACGGTGAVACPNPRPQQPSSGSATSSQTRSRSSAPFFTTGDREIACQYSGYNQVLLCESRRTHDAISIGPRWAYATTPFSYVLTSGEPAVLGTWRNPQQTISCQVSESSLRCAGQAGSASLTSR